MNFTRTIFLTGFPGFIAERLVARLAGSDVQFLLLVQPQFVERARRSIGRVIEQASVPAENFGLIEGDITLPDLGMSAEDIAIVRECTTEVFHLAAIYDLAVARDAAHEVNLGGTKNVNELVKTLRHLRRYNYISTCYVAGLRSGCILESELEHTAGFRNFYEETKYFAEIEVEKLKEHLPVTIFRPSVVVGDSKTGETAKYDGIYYLIQYLRRAPRLLRLVNVGNKDVTLNLVPVDFVVDGIAALASEGNAIGKTIALADPAPLTTGQLFDAIAENLSGKRSVIGPPPVAIEKFLRSPISPPSTGLPHSAVPYFFVSQTYDTAVANELLGRYRIICPNFAEYLPALLKFVAKHPRL